MQSEQWRDAMAAAKLAVRAYARDPSSSNAAEVELAWQRVRRLQRVAEWRRPKHRSRPESVAVDARAPGGPTGPR
jgi:hypothetical protein